ncbi:hypothetical protein BJY01DRAFT_221394 [Aspergillus pseudoustus]|uniref:DUF7730 domain-containing protein n=1 Tax=Aspergillus pseudoustus TaxID=1810923 RepID=A0ABR4JAC5_9EURO
MVNSDLFQRMFHRSSGRDWSAPQAPREQSPPLRWLPRSAVTSARRSHTPDTAETDLPHAQIPYWYRAVLDSPGIRPESCRVKGPRYTASHLPVLAEDHTALFTTLNDDAELNLQEQSPFFTKLPPEIREMIYVHAFGSRRIHMDFDFHRVSTKRGRWGWWHRVCDDAENCLANKTFVCAEAAATEESMLRHGSGAWVKQGFQYYVAAVNWLRCCKLGFQESLPILYKTNTFVFSHGIDQLHRLNKILPAAHLEMITSLSVEIDVYRACKAIGPPKMHEEFQDFYRGFFNILEQRLSGLKELSVAIAGLPNPKQRRDGEDTEWLDDDEERWIGPWEELAASRTWKRLDIVVPVVWFDELKAVVQRRGKLEKSRGYGLERGVDPFRKGW